MQTNNVTLITHILKNTYTSKSEYYTHVSLFNASGQSTGRYNLDGDTQDKLFDTFSEIIDEKGVSLFGLAEKPTFYNPVLCDIDLNVKLQEEEKEMTRLYTPFDVENLVKIYCDVIRKIIPEIPDKNLKCVLLEKQPYYSRNGQCLLKKSGFHLHFPNVFLHNSVHSIHLLPRVKKLVAEKHFENIKPENVDDSYFKVPWLMYGCSKGEGLYPYKATRVYDHNCKIQDLSILKECVTYDIHQKEIEYTDDIEKYLPRILSIFPRGRKCFDTKFIQENLPVPIQLNLNSFEDMPMSDDRSYSQVSLDLQFTEELLKLVSIDRARDRNKWIEIGWVLFCISRGSREGLLLWTNFSKQCPDKFSECRCIYEWNEMSRGGYTIATLIYYAKCDSPKKYVELTSERNRSSLRKNLKFTHRQIANVMFNEYRGEIIYCMGNKKWYEFRNHIWKDYPEDYIIDKYTSAYVPKLINQMLRDLSEIEEDDEFMEKKRKVLLSARTNIESSPFKRNVIKECNYVFHCEEFESKLDDNPYLFAFQNGVIDLKALKFRDGKPEDYLSKQAKVNYNANLTWSDPSVKKMQEYLSKVFPDSNIREYFINFCTSIFIGGNKDKEFTMLVGEKGDNAKSITIKLIEYIFGPYACKAPTTIITEKRRNSSGAAPEIARCGGGVRIVIVQEPEKSDNIYIGQLKEETGGDTYFARKLYENGTDLTRLYKLVMVCNAPPAIRDIDRATRGRLRVIPFESIFVDKEDAPATIKEQYQQKTFPKDPYYEDNIPSIAEAFVWILMEQLYRGKYNKKIPQRVQIATKTYADRNDVYRQYLAKYISPASNANTTLDTMVVWREFQTWFREAYPSRRLTDMPDFVHSLSEHLGDVTNYMWSGWIMLGSC